MTAEYAVGHLTARLTVLEQWLGDAGHHLTRLAARVTDHEMVDAV